MGTWNYRILKHDRHDDSFGLHAVYYDNNEKPKSYSMRACGFVSGEDEGFDGLRMSLTMAMTALDKPVLLESDFPHDTNEVRDPEDARKLLESLTGIKEYVSRLDKAKNKLDSDPEDKLYSQEETSAYLEDVDPPHVLIWYDPKSTWWAWAVSYQNDARDEEGSCVTFAEALTKVARVVAKQGDENSRVTFAEAMKKVARAVK